MKKKKVCYDFSYYVILPTRKSQVVFKDNQYLDVIEKDPALKSYFKKNSIELLDLNSYDEGKALFLKFKAHPDNSVSSVVFNFRRFCFQIIKKDETMMQRLHGEESIWTRDFVLGTNLKETQKLYQKFMEENDDSYH